MNKYTVKVNLFGKKFEIRNVEADSMLQAEDKVLELIKNKASITVTQNIYTDRNLFETLLGNYDSNPFKNFK